MGKQHTIRGSGRLRRYGVPGAFLSDKIIERNLKYHTESVMMLHVGRVGSTVLGRMMDRHSRVAWPGEIFYRIPARHGSNRRSVEDVREIVRQRAGQSAAEIFGFEVKHGPTQDLSPAITNLTFPQMLDLFAEFGGKRIVHLKRRNIIRRCVSAELARQRGRYHEKSSVGELPKVELPLQDVLYDYGRFDLINVLELIDACDRNTAERASGFDLLSLTYEDDIEQNPEVAFGKLCDFLNIAREDCAPDLKKIDTRPLRDVIANFAEVERYLAGTPYQQQLFE